MNEQEYLLNKEMMYHLNSAMLWYREDYKTMAYEEIQICIGMVYAAVAIHFLTVQDALTILGTLRASELYVGYPA